MYYNVRHFNVLNLIHFNVLRCKTYYNVMHFSMYYNVIHLNMLQSNTLQCNTMQGELHEVTHCKVMQCNALAIAGSPRIPWTETFVCGKTRKAPLLQATVCRSLYGITAADVRWKGVATCTRDTFHPFEVSFPGNWENNPRNKLRDDSDS